MIVRIYNFIDKVFFRYQFIRFAVTGSITAVIDFGLLALLTELAGIHYLASATLSFIAAVAVNFLLSKYWTFQNKRKDSARQFFIFAVIIIVGLIANNTILYLSVELFSLHYLIGKIVATAIVMFWNFFMNKFVTFREYEPKRFSKNA